MTKKCKRCGKIMEENQNTISKYTKDDNVFEWGYCKICDHILRERKEKLWATEPNCFGGKNKVI